MISYRMIAAAAALFFTGIAIAVCAVLLAAVPAQAKVDVIQSASPALASGARFAWAPVPATGYGISNPMIANQITADRLRAATEMTLRNKGYRQVADPREADLLVAHTVVMLPATEAKRTVHLGCAAPLCDGPIDYSFEVSDQMQGTLVLDLTERETGRLVWRATSEKRVTGKDVSQRKLATILRKMTKSLPPK